MNFSNFQWNCIHSQYLLDALTGDLLLDGNGNNENDNIDFTEQTFDLPTFLSSFNTHLTSMEQNMQQNNQVLQTLVESSVKVESSLHFLMKHLHVDSDSNKGPAIAEPMPDDNFEREFNPIDSIEDIMAFENIITDETYLRMIPNIYSERHQIITLSILLVKIPSRTLFYVAYASSICDFDWVWSS